MCCLHLRRACHVSGRPSHLQLQQYAPSSGSHANARAPHTRRHQTLHAAAVLWRCVALLHRTRTADALVGQGAQCTRLSPNGASCRAPTPPVYGSLPQPLVTLMLSELRVCPMRAHANTQREAEQCSLRKRTPCEPPAPPLLLACRRSRTARPASPLPDNACAAVQGSARLAL